MAFSHLFLWNLYPLRTGPTGLEPATSAVTGRCSNQLNYGPPQCVFYCADNCQFCQTFSTGIFSGLNCDCVRVSRGHMGKKTLATQNRDQYSAPHEPAPTAHIFQHG
jgi:hypothetical protein